MLPGESLSDDQCPYYCPVGPISMPECQNCGSFVTETYARVFTPTEVEQPRVCPHCEDKLRDGAEIRKARTSRSN